MLAKLWASAINIFTRGDSKNIINVYGSLAGDVFLGRYAREANDNITLV